MSNQSRIASLDLYLAGTGHARCELTMTKFRYDPLKCQQFCSRGKDGGALTVSGTFQWTRAVRAVTTLFLLHKVSNKRLQMPFNDESVTSCLFGLKGSLASSLDLAISKQPQWLWDMFGTDINGTPIAYRIFKRTNSSLKRFGPVIVGVRDSQLSQDDISVHLNGELIDSSSILSILASWKRIHQEGNNDSNCSQSSRSIAFS